MTNIAEKIIKPRLGVLELAKQLGNVSKACKIMFCWHYKRYWQTNGIVERFHRTMKQEFYDIAFRNKIYHNLEELQKELDAWLEQYNNFRPHAGKYCYGKTPMQTFKDSKHITNEKNISSILDKADNSTYLTSSV